MKRIIFSTAMLLVLAAGLLTGPARTTAAPTAQNAPPPGFSEILAQPGVSLFKKDYDNGTPDFVQQARLDEGAALRLLAGESLNAGIGQGAYGGDNPTFARQTLRRFWSDLQASTPNAFCVTNGAFFSTETDPTPLAFPLKIDGRLVSEGYGRDEYPGQKLMLELWNDHAQISPLTVNSLRDSAAPNILGGLAEDADKSPAVLTGRTFVGVADRDGNGSAETVLVYSTQTSSQADAADVLRGFGALAVMMLDGGDSTQLICSDVGHVTSSRTVPQALAVLSRQPAPLSADVVRQTTFPILVEGETTLIEIEMRNAGSENWREGTDRLVNRKNPYGADAEYPLLQDILPGQTTLFSWRTQAFDKWGAYTTEWRMQRSTTLIEGSEVRVTIIVLPKELEEKRAELQGKVRQWAAEKAEDIEALILAWIQEQLDRIVKDTTRNLCGSPLLPILAALAFAVRHRWLKL